MSDNGHANGTPAPIPPEQPKWVQIHIVVDPANISRFQMRHDGIHRIAVLQILGECVKVCATQHAQEVAHAAATKVEAAPASALRALPRIDADGR